MRTSDYKLNAAQAHEYTNKAVRILFTQMSAKKGIEKHGERAIAVLIKEFKQLNEGAILGKPVIEPVDPQCLTVKEMRNALNVVSLIREKRDGSLKGRACADGRKQRAYIEKENIDISSPTVSLEGLFTSLLIDAYEKRKIATFDVAGAFLQPELTERPDKLLLKLQDIYVDIMCEVNPEFKDTVIYEKRRKTLYMKAIQSIYGCLEAAILWYKLYSEKLVDMGFEINPYDLCIANKMINAKQCTVAWHVDDNKVSHVNQSVIDQVIKELESEFGKFWVTKGNVHNYLGMKISMRNDGKI